MNKFNVDDYVLCKEDNVYRLAKVVALEYVIGKRTNLFGETVTEHKYTYKVDCEQQIISVFEQELITISNINQFKIKPV